MIGIVRSPLSLLQMQSVITKDSQVAAAWLLTEGTDLRVGSQQNFHLEEKLTAQQHRVTTSWCRKTNLHAPAQYYAH